MFGIGFTSTATSAESAHPFFTEITLKLEFVVGVAYTSLVLELSNEFPERSFQTYESADVPMALKNTESPSHVMVSLVNAVTAGAVVFTKSVLLLLFEHPFALVPITEMDVPLGMLMMTLAPVSTLKAELGDQT